MSRLRPFLFHALVILWGLVLALCTFIFFFPHQRLFQDIPSGIFGPGQATVSARGVRTRIAAVTAQNVTIARREAPGVILCEASRVRFSLLPRSLLAGRLSAVTEAQLYGGTVAYTIGIPFLYDGPEKTVLSFRAVDLAGYPDGAFPWFRETTGVLRGSIVTEWPAARPDSARGTFSLLLSEGEIRGLRIKGYEALLFPYRKFVITGRFNGPRIDVQRLSIEGKGFSMRGSGILHGTEHGYTSDLSIAYKPGAGKPPLPGPKVLTVTGDLWFPVMSIADQTVREKDAYIDRVVVTNETSADKKQ